MPVDAVTAECHDRILEQWLAAAAALSQGRFGTLIDARELREQTAALLDQIFAAMRLTAGEPAVTESLQALLGEIGVVRARQGFTPSETAAYILLAKNALPELLTGQADPLAEMIRLGRFVDRLALVTVEAFANAREDLIRRQSAAILELSTPIIKLWDQVLMMPVVGVIDTARAKYMTEQLLEGIVRHEALVVVFDVTGVPVIDTRVARHLLMSVNAARLVGAETIMTGISPNAALTLTSLGVDLSSIRTRGTLRSGVAEALRLVGRRVVALEDGA